ncbi:MAG: tail fiber domain-containing protein [Nanoarchaeota archaeon]|nr:tail fiber domain-containing protein [Nanoarchaeota archaeon]
MNKKEGHRFFSNRLLYSLIAFGIIAVLTVGVYALTPGGNPAGTPSQNPGHLISSIDPPTPCAAPNNYLSFDGTNWACTAGGGGQWVTLGNDISYNLGRVDVNSKDGAGGYISSGSKDGTGTAAYFPSGIYVPQTPTSWIYSDNIYLGSTSGDTINFRANTITGTGSITAGEFIYNSDRNLKTKIQPLQNSLSKVMQLQGVSFDWKASGERNIGFIAQDVEKVLPELVSGTEGHKGVAYGNIVAVLVEAIKEQQKQIDKLKSQLQEMKEN